MYLSTKHVFQQQFVRLIEEELQRLQEMLMNGSVHSMEDYKHLVGRVSGLRSALEYVEEANAHVERGM